MKILSLLSGKNKVSTKSHVKNLVELAKIDGHYDPREDILLNEIAKRDSVNRAFIKKVENGSDNIELQIPEAEDLRFKQFYDLVKMMLADDMVHELEMQLIRSLGMKFGYKKEYLDELIDSIIQNIKNGHEAMEAKERVKWMLIQD